MTPNPVAPRTAPKPTMMPKRERPRTPPRISSPVPLRQTAPIPLDLDKLYAARLYAARARPYLATALFALNPVESHSVPTMAVDRHWRCYVSPVFVAQMSEEDLASVWVHEVSHLLRDHHGRGERYAARHELSGPAERLRMNIAADCEINDDAYGDGLVQPRGAIRAEFLGLPDGELMEEYLGRFRLGAHTQNMVWLDCGSGADGSARPWDLGADGAHGLTAQERDAVRFRVAQGIKGSPGNVPDGWRRWAQETFHPPQPWRQLLGAAIRSAATGPGAGEDYSYGRPSRRSAGLPGVIVPSLRRRPPTVCVIIDTSGSVSDSELGSAIVEVAAIGRAVGNRRDLVKVLPCDAAATVVHTLCRAEGIALIGGGGTDLRTGFARALRTSPRPDVIVVLTDGQTPWPSGRPPCRTVVGLFPRPAGGWTVPRDDPEFTTLSPPDWARVVDIG